MTQSNKNCPNNFGALLNEHIDEYWKLFDDAKIDRKDFFKDAKPVYMEVFFRAKGDLENSEKERQGIKNLCTKHPHLPEQWIRHMAMGGFLITSLLKKEKKAGLSDYQKASYASAIAEATGAARSCLITSSSVDLEKLEKQLFSDMSRKGANARHAPTRDAKKTVFDHLDKNPPLHRGKDSAALAMAGTLVSEGFRTVRKWIDDWEKQRATGRE